MSVSLVVINSWGPMGSSLLASLVEKWGYLNIPIRQTGLTEYLMGRRPLTDPAIRKNFRQSIVRAGFKAWPTLGTQCFRSRLSRKQSLD